MNEEYKTNFIKSIEKRATRDLNDYEIALNIIQEEHNRTKKEIEIIEQATQEIERLHSIIREVREYIAENMGYYTSRLEHREYIERYVYDLNKIMKLLDNGE